MRYPLCDIIIGILSCSDTSRSYYDHHLFCNMNTHGPTKGHIIAENQNMKTLGFGFVHRLCRQIVMFYATRNYAMGVCVVLAALYTVCDTTVGRIFVCLGPSRTLTIEVITRYCHFKMRA